MDPPVPHFLLVCLTRCWMETFHFHPVQMRFSLISHAGLGPLLMLPKKQTNKPTSPSTNQPTNQPINQPTNPPTNQPTHPPTHQPTNQPTHQPINQSTNQPTNPSTHQPTNQPTLDFSDTFKKRKKNIWIMFIEFRNKFQILVKWKSSRSSRFH